MRRRHLPPRRYYGGIKKNPPVPTQDEGILLCRGYQESDVVGGGGGIAAPAGPVGVEKLAAGLVDPLVGVSPEVVALGLEQIGGKTFAAVAVEVGQSAAEGGYRYTVSDGGGDYASPGFLAGLDRLSEVGGEEEVGQIMVAVESILDAAEELGADDAAAAPHEGDAAVVEMPVVFGSGHGEELEALGIRADFGGVEGATDVFDERVPIAVKTRLRAPENGGGGGSFFFEGGDATGKYRLGNGGGRGTQ